MEVLNISVDENEEDTSCDELEDDPEFTSPLLASPLRKKFVNSQDISREGQFSKLFRAWERPPVPEATLLYTSSSLQAQPDPFRFLFLDSVSSVSKIRHPSVRVSPAYQGHVDKTSLHPVMRLFGVAQVPSVSASQDLFDEPDFMNSAHFNSQYSISVCCNVHGFYPYFYALPTEEIFQTEQLPEVLFDLRKVLNRDVKLAILQNLNMAHLHDFIEAGNEPVLSIQVHEVVDVATKIFHFPSVGHRDKSSLVLKIVLALPMFISTAAVEMSKLRVDHYAPHPKHKQKYFEFDIYENNLNNNLRFLATQNIPGCTWLELKAGAYFSRNEEPDLSNGIERESHCQIELDVYYEDLIKLYQQPDRIPALRILSLDLESRVNTQKIPKGSGFNGMALARNQIIQIGAVLATYGEPDNSIIGKAAFVLGTCDPLPETEILEFYDPMFPSDVSEQCLLKYEAVMLSAFRDFVIQMDPDIITGYNIKNFDLPCLLNRSDKLFHDFDEAKNFAYLGRLKKVQSSIRPIVNKNKRMYSFDHKIINVQGRIVMDMYPLFKRHVPDRRPLKLKDVAKHFLKSGEEKDDVKYTEINGLQDGTPQTRCKLAKYCVQDSYLPVKLMLVHLPDRKAAEINFIQYYFELARLGGPIFRYLVNKSKEYSKYFKQVRVQKNDGQVKYHPDTPSPKKPANGTKDELAANAPSPIHKPLPSISTVLPLPIPKMKKKYCSRMLFTDEDD